ncbi:DUF397 domain-containing protein [Streptomyces sp. NPDC056716]|uniref:DUF397 domain-containing protein n=1 Tax=unclassified Streptomyces TaxID=2593676 RepID=UPI00369A0C86
MNPNEHLARVRWVRSSYSGPEGGNCLEVAPDAVAVFGIVPVRDSKNPQGPALAFPVEQWRSFVAHLTQHSRAQAS